MCPCFPIWNLDIKLKAAVVLLWPWSEAEDEIHALRMEKQKDKRLKPWCYGGAPFPALHHLLPDLNWHEGKKIPYFVYVPVCLFVCFYYFEVEHSSWVTILSEQTNKSMWLMLFPRKMIAFRWHMSSKSYKGIFLNGHTLEISHIR